MPEKQGQDQGGIALAYRRGVRPVLITAPHQYPHWRTNRFKVAEPHTGPIARNLARRTACHSLVTRGRQKFDPNFDENCPFKDKIAEIHESCGVEFLLDLHGAAPYREFAFAIGTNDGTTTLGHDHLIESLVEALTPVAGGMPTMVNPSEKFGARHRFTVSRYASEELLIPSAQVEINWRLAERWHDIADALAPFLRSNFPLQNR